MRDHFRPPLPHACPRCGEPTHGTRSPKGLLWAECSACWAKITEEEIVKLRAMGEVMRSVGPSGEKLDSES
jgi:ribosomal protein L37AE/L43A